MVDKSGVHDQVVVARDLECQNKENFGQLLGKAVAHESASGDQSLTTRNTLVLESQHPLATNKTVDLALDPVNAKVVADGPQHDARGVETIECLVDNMTQQVDNANKKI